MGFAAEIVFVLRLGLLVFGPSRLRAMPGGVVPTDFEDAKSCTAKFATGFTQRLVRGVRRCCMSKVHQQIT